MHKFDWTSKEYLSAHDSLSIFIYTYLNPLLIPVSKLLSKIDPYNNILFHLPFAWHTKESNLLKSDVDHWVHLTHNPTCILMLHNHDILSKSMYNLSDHLCIHTFGRALRLSSISKHEEGCLVNRSLYFPIKLKCYILKLSMVQKF